MKAVFHSDKMHQLLRLTIKDWPQVVRVCMMTSQQYRTSVCQALSAELGDSKQALSRKAPLFKQQGLALTDTGNRHKSKNY
jgi:hypothetical protein